jgi:uncharacterized protein (DUF1499 family)
MLILLFFSYIGSDTSKVIVKKSILIDEDYLKNEMQEVVLDFIEDVNLNPDSCYIPFKSDSII